MEFGKDELRDEYEKLVVVAVRNDFDKIIMLYEYDTAMALLKYR